MIELTSLPVLALCAAILTYLLRRQIAFLLTPSPIPGVPNVPGTIPILGDIPFLAGLEKTPGGGSHGMGELAKTLGPIYLARVGWMFKFLIISDYDETERIFLSPGAAKTLDKGEYSRGTVGPILWKAIVGLPMGDTWKHHVRIMGPAMTPKYLRLMMPRMTESIMEVIELWKAKIPAAGGRAWSAAKDMEGGTMDAIWGVAFGESAGMIPSFRAQLAAASRDLPEDDTGAVIFPSERPGVANSTLHVFESVSNNPAFNGALHWFTRKLPSYRRHNSRLQAYLSQRIEDARRHAAAKGVEAAVETAGCTLDMMVAREMRGEDWMPDDEMKQELLEYLVAGTETSGVLLTWWLKFMSNHPHIQRKLRQHLLDTCPEILDRPLQYEDIAATKTPYLEAVMWESLRLSKTAGGFMREAIEDTMILGHRIPKGTGIIFVGAMSHQDESGHNEKAGYIRPAGAQEWKRKVGHWKAGTGTLFQPDRWIDAEGNFDANAGPSLHFGMGQRSCFGRNLAMLEIKLFIANLSTNFFFTALPPHQNGSAVKETVARHPIHPYIRPVMWSSPEAQE